MIQPALDFYIFTDGTFDGQNDKLIAANTGNNVRTAKSLSQQIGQRHNGVIANRVPQCVIDLLQAVNIEKNQQ